MTISVYIRISSQTQSTDAQQAEITRWLEAHKVCLDDVTWYEDIESGAKLDRAGLKALNKAVFDGSVSTIVVWKLDRLSRSLRDGLNILSDWCDGGVRVVSVTQQIDLQGAIGKTVASVLLGVAEIELENIRERQAAGIGKAKERGVYKGRKAGTTKAKPQRAREMRDNGWKVEEIMRALEIKSRTTVWKYLNL